jgi:uncharacterized protein (TIGR00730 family)
MSPHQSINETQSNLLKSIQDEFEKGFLALNELPPQTVTFYGGAHVEPDSKIFKLTYNLAKEFGSRGWGVLSGGGPGVMQAALLGADDAKGVSVGFRIDINGEEMQTPADVVVDFKQFLVRKYLLRQSDIFVFAPGGIGTLDEMFEVLCLIKTNKIKPRPIFLLDSLFWKDIEIWIEKMLIGERHYAGSEFTQLYSIVDTMEEVTKSLF